MQRALNVALSVCVVMGSGQFVSAEQERGCGAPTVGKVKPKYVCVGEEVKIRGANFGSKMGTVEFYPGVVASVSKWGDTKIIATVPPGAERGKVTIISRCGEKGKAKKTWTPCDVYVSAAAGSDKDGNGSPNTPWQSIGHAIRKAKGSKKHFVGINVAAGL